jgi:hypothetical protein
MLPPGPQYIYPCSICSLGTFLIKVFIVENINKYKTVHKNASLAPGLTPVILATWEAEIRRI